MCVSDSFTSDSFQTPWTVVFQAPLSKEFSSKNTGVGSLFLFQGIFSTQGSHLRLLHCRQIPYPLSHQGSPVQHRGASYLTSCLFCIFPLLLLTPQDWDRWTSSFSFLCVLFSFWIGQQVSWSEYTPEKKNSIVWISSTDMWVTLYTYLLPESLPIYLSKLLLNIYTWMSKKNLNLRIINTRPVWLPVPVSVPYSKDF